MRYAYPYDLEPDEETFIVSFPDVPGALTSGDTLGEALENAEEVLDLILGCCIEDQSELPIPSPLADEESSSAVLKQLVALRPAFAAKLALHAAIFVTPRVKTLKVPDDGEIEASGPDLAEMMVVLLRPASHGELKLRSTNPNVQPWLDHNYLSEPFDRQRLRHGVRQALQLAQHEGLKELLGDRLEPADPDLASDEALDAWMLREAVTYSHISGTCKMGPSSDPMAVVDQFGRVYGLEGLRVSDASIMPDLVRAPINPAVLMLSERIADFVRQGL